MASLTRAWGRDPRQPVTSLREQMRRAEREREEGEVQLLVRVAVGVQDEVVPVVRVVRREGHDVVGVLLDYATALLMTALSSRPRMNSSSVPLGVAR
jgi:hypothetical protein